MVNKLLSAKELGEKLGMNHQTLLKLERAGRIPSHRLSPKVIRFKPGEVVRALEAAQAKARANKSVPPTDDDHRPPGDAGGSC